MKNAKEQSKRNEAEPKCAMCDGQADAEMRERLANGDAQLCEPCYKFEYKLED